MQSRLDECFTAAREEGRSLLVGYLPAGYPTVDGAIAAMRAMVAAGVDVVEVGLPYSDPTMDGPVIQDAADAALRGGVTTADVLRTVEAVAATGAPTVVMTYWNPIDRYGPARFAADLAAAGGAGAITPDLPPEEAAPWLAASAEHGLDPVFLVAPSSSDARIRLVTGISRGFVYAASLMGVTGTRAAVGTRAADLVARVRATTELPVAVGLGVSTGAQAAEVAGFADGVIVGSALVKVLVDAQRSGAGDAAALDGIGRLAAELAEGVRAPVPASA
ncbi:tryptophan synthase subunit alpha [Frankia sp. ACN1ag]|uniref:tryptophan synthase subunit alpha n=1 Tax=Frankia sp. ACN1ag TaxID=102891 RepID=UPI0006DC7242|nr:tryptophan synthase subunit alpha [Frankia sp. ACN1ag]KQC39992.1 tryptophan synthase subunit alpha [Frankia sp. ACN1ag]